MAGREGKDLLHKAHQVFGFAGKYNRPGLVIAIVKRTDANGIPSRDELLLFSVIQDAGVFGIQHREHLHAVLKIQGKQDLTVAVTVEGVFSTQLRAEFFEAIDFAVADNGAGIQGKGLHAFRVQTHDGKTVKTKNALTHIQNAGIIGAAGDRSGKALLKRCHVQGLSAITNNGTHICFLLKTDPWESRKSGSPVGLLCYSTSCRAS